MAFNCPAEIYVKEKDKKSQKIGTIILRYDVPEDPNADAIPKGFSVDPPGTVSVPNDKARQLLNDYKGARRTTFRVNVLKSVFVGIDKQEDADCSEAGTILEYTRCTYRVTELIIAGGVRLSKQILKDEPPIIRERYGDYCTRRIFLFLVDIAIEIYKSLANKDQETSRKVALLPSNFRANFEDSDKFAALMDIYQDALEGRGFDDFDEPALVPPVITEVAFRDFGRLLGNRTTGEPRDVPQLEALESGSATFDDIVNELVNLDDGEAQDLVQLIGDIQNRRIAAGGVSTDEAWMIEAVDAVENRDPGDWPSLIFAREQDV